MLFGINFSSRRLKKLDRKSIAVHCVLHVPGTLSMEYYFNIHLLCYYLLNVVCFTIEIIC